MTHVHRRWGRGLGRSLVAALAALVLAATGYGWSAVHRLDAGLSRAPVIDPAPPSPTTGARAENILLVGLDSRTDAQGERLAPDILAALHAGGSGNGGDVADTVIVVHVPSDGSGATALSIPRDSYVELPGAFGKHKLNSAYAYGHRAALARLGSAEPDAAAEREADSDGARTLIGTVESLTGLSVTHYVALNLVGFYRISQAIGGVRVCLRSAVHDDFTGLDLPAGSSVIQGTQALAFVRQRHGLPDGDLSRIRRQQVFLASMVRRVVARGLLSDPVRGADLAAALRTSMTVDEGLDPLALADRLHQLTGDRLTFRTVPVLSTALRTPDGEAVKVDPEQVRTFVADLTGSPTAAMSDPQTAGTVAGGTASGSGAPDPGGATAVTEPAVTVADQQGCVD